MPPKNRELTEAQIAKEKAIQKEIIDRVLPKVLGIMEKEGINSIPHAIAVLMSGLTTILNNQAGKKDLESVRSLIEEIKSQMLNQLSEAGWQ